MPITKFSPGDKLKVVNIDPLPGNAVAPPLTIGQDVTVINMFIDQKGYEHINVGLVSEFNYISSNETGEEIPGGDKIHWCHPSRFQYPHNADQQ